MVESWRPNSGRAGSGIGARKRTSAEKIPAIPSAGGGGSGSQETSARIGSGEHSSL